MHGRTDERMDGRTNGRTDELILKDGRTDGRMDQRTNGRTDKRNFLIFPNFLNFLILKLEGS